MRRSSDSKPGPGSTGSARRFAPALLGPAALLAMLAGGPGAWAQGAPEAARAPAARAAEARNMRLVGQHDLQARSAYQPTIQRQGERWILYVGHHGGNRADPKPPNPLTGERESTAPRSWT